MGKKRKFSEIANWVNNARYLQEGSLDNIPERKSIPTVVRERRANFSHRMLPMPPKLKLCAHDTSKKSHILYRHANKEIYKQVAAMLDDYGVSAKEVQEVWDTWAKVIRDAIEVGSGETIQMPSFGNFLPKEDKQYENLPKFDGVLQEFIYTKKKISILDWERLPEHIKEELENLNREHKIIFHPEVVIELFNFVRKEWAKNGITKTEYDDVQGGTE